MSDSQCGCMKENRCSNGEIIAAQFLSIVACVIAIFCLFTSPSGFELWLIFFSWILMIFYQVLWCVRIPKKLHRALIVPTLIISGCNFYTAIDWVGLNGTVSSFYWAQAVPWLVAAILQLVFVFKKSEIKENEEDADNVDAVEDV